jgi:hypothetical protein
MLVWAIISTAACVFLGWLFFTKRAELIEVTAKYTKLRENLEFFNHNPDEKPRKKATKKIPKIEETTPTKSKPMLCVEVQFYSGQYSRYYDVSNPRFLPGDATISFKQYGETIKVYNVYAWTKFFADRKTKKEVGRE